MKRKILFLSPIPPPYYGSAMSSKMCLEILENSKNFEIRNIKLNYSEDMEDVGKINKNKIKGFLKVKKEIKKNIKGFNPDIIYLVPATSNLGLIRDYFFVKEIKKLTKKKILFHIRSRTIKNNFNMRLYKKMFSGERAIVLGEQLIKDISNYIPRREIFILPNAIKNEVSEKEIKKIIKQRQKKRFFNILFLSNMDKSKGWPKLLQACKILKKQNLKFNCNFVGDFKNEKDKSMFYNFVEKNNLQREINYLGKKTGKEKNKIISESNVLVFPTEYKLETFGRVIIEGMMFGLPVIANGIATIPSIIQDNKTGFILKNNSPKEIAEKIIKLENPFIRENMGLEGRKRFLKNYELKKYEKEFVKILNSS